MRMRTALAILAVAILAAGAGACDREAPGGMPPAAEWKPPAPKQSVVEGGGRGRGRARGSASHALAADPADPHAGVDMEADGEAEEGGGDDGAAEVDPSAEGAEGDEENPHGADEEQMAPRETLARGEIRAAGEAAAVVKPGAVVYLSAVPIDSASGQPSGSAVAVDRFEVQSLPMPFELSGKAFRGEVLITAWTDADGEARTREAGDAEGRVRARLPADGVSLVLDKVLK
jgi:hypothetical protein